jgi:hypothetical protein
MNPSRVTATAKALDVVLRTHGRDAEVTSLADDIRAVLSKALAGEISGEMAWRDIPGGRYFMEGGLRKYRDLEQAFADFRLALIGDDET